MLNYRLLFVAALSLSAAQAGLVINASYDASVTTQQQAAVNYVIQEYENAFTNNIHINIDVTTMSSGLGESSTNLLGYYTYAQIRSDLTTHATDANDTSAVASLGATDPTGGANFVLTHAQAKALGAISDDTTTGSDGTFSFNNTVAYTYGPATIGAPGTSRNVSGQYDFIGVAEHEISEIMGRIAGLGTIGSSADTTFDLFRYTSAGVRNMSTSGTGVYYSINGGTTDLAGFNSIPGEDLGDLDGTVATDPYNAATGPGQAHSLSATDLSMLDVIGYTSTSTPEPSSIIMFTSAGLLIGLARLRR